MIVSTSKRLRLRGMTIGTKSATVRRRLKVEQRFKVGKSIWYVARGGRSTLLYRTSAGRVRELGVATNTLTKKRRTIGVLLRAWGSAGL